LQTPSEGLILGDPNEWWAWEYWYDKDWPDNRPWWIWARPNIRLVLDGPLIAGDPGILPYGYGYDGDKPTPADPDQDKFIKQPIHPMPYLGDLALYKTIAKNFLGIPSQEAMTSGTLLQCA